MKVFGLLIAACAVVTVYGEVCTINTDCKGTTCVNGTSVICQHPDSAGIVANGGLCTCSDTGGCSKREDCYGTSALACPDSMRHCYDNRCICDRFPTGKK